LTDAGPKADTPLAKIDDIEFVRTIAVARAGLSFASDQWFSYTDAHHDEATVIHLEAFGPP
jgi:hypothetical protein